MREAIDSKTVPHCLDDTCNGFVKPDIVFFGEQLPRDFFANRHLPSLADLVIVMGTSLSVHPFAALPQLCDEKTPRILINGERVGDFGTRADDVLLIQDCDSGVRELAHACGWAEELEALWKKTEREGKDRPVGESKKNRDEQLEAEIEQLTRDVEENLRLSQAQHAWLENHVDNKLARAGEDRLGSSKEGDSKTMASVAKTEQPDSSSGLGHVFPFANG